MYTISLDRLTKRYGPVLAVDGLSVDVGPGRVPGFLGPNGSGKTTTLRMRLGLVAPDSGTATINGVRYRDLPHPACTVGAAALRSVRAPLARWTRRSAAVLLTLATTAHQELAAAPRAEVIPPGECGCGRVREAGSRGC
jgi:ABC-type branched-subunit amino acid transport system ATPase component